MNNAVKFPKYNSASHRLSISTVTDGNAMKIRDGFNALGFRHGAYDGLMDPLIMVDHYSMTKPTFGAHPHAGLSAVSLLFEDSIGKFHNQDSLGNDFDLLPGDLYWLNAGSGIVHDEAPREGAKIHGLQVFVNLPESLKHAAPQSTLVRATQMPLLTSESYRVRVVIGESNGIRGSAISPNDMTILDGKLFGTGGFSHQTANNEHSWVYAVSGNIEVTIGGQSTSLAQGQAVSIKTASLPVEIRGVQHTESHFVLFSGRAIEEKFIQRGPFAMSSEAELDKVQHDYEQGLFGEIPK